MRAGYADSSWLHRMETQPDYLLNHPIFSTLETPEHMRIHEMNFKDMFQEAMRLEIADQRGDWEPVKIGSDGVDVVNPDASGVDDAMAALAAMKGKKPKLPKLDGGIEDPRTPGTLPSSPAAPKTVDQAKKDRAVREMARRMGVDVQPEPPPQQVEPESEKESDENEPETAPAAAQAPTPTPPQPKPDQPPPPQSQNPRFMGNTPQPNRGIMVDGPEPPTPTSADPWAPKPKENVVKPHHTVKFGKDKDDD